MLPFGSWYIGTLFQQLIVVFIQLTCCFNWTTIDSDSRRSKLLSRKAGTSHYQNPNIYTSEESSQWALFNNYHWLLWTPLMRELLAFLIFPIQISKERKTKLQVLEHTSFGWHTIFPKSSQWNIVWCALFGRSRSHSWEWPVSIKYVNLPKLL